MKTTYFLSFAVVAATLLPSCDSNEVIENEPFPIGYSFDLQSFSTVSGARSPVGGANVRIRFQPDEAFDGWTFTSETGHNFFWGSYRVDSDGAFSATFGAITEVAEPTGSRLYGFLDALFEVTRFRYSGGRLLLFYGDGQLLVLKRVSDAESL